MDKTTPMKRKPLVDVTCKLGTKGCFEDGRCHALGNCENKITTNADRFRAMSDEELEKAIGHSSLCYYIQDTTNFCEERASCGDCIREWLKQPAEESDGNGERRNEA